MENSKRTGCWLLPSSAGKKLFYSGKGWLSGDRGSCLCISVTPLGYPLPSTCPYYPAQFQITAEWTLGPRRRSHAWWREVWWAKHVAFIFKATARIQWWNNTSATWFWRPTLPWQFLGFWNRLAGRKRKHFVVALCHLAEHGGFGPTSKCFQGVMKVRVCLLFECSISVKILNLLYKVTFLKVNFAIYNENIKLALTF